MTSESRYDLNLMMDSVYTRRSRSGLLIVLCLCVCVMAQMLGVPVTLMNPGEFSDLLGSSVLEGFSVLPQVPKLLLSFTLSVLVDVSSPAHVPVIASALFHPPVR